jgi:dihydroxyacetone kinase-like protein
MEHLPLAPILARIEETVRSRRTELDALDAALGDGDHGTNLAHALTLLRARAGHLAELPLAAALQAMAATVAEAMGGSGGRMYAAFLRGMAEVAGDGRPDWPRTLAMLRAGRLALERESGLGRGSKTLLDVLAPVVEALERAHAGSDADDLGRLALAAAGHAMHHTRDLVAAWPPANALGRNSLEHIDPGACSAALVIGAIVGVLCEQPAAS